MRTASAIMSECREMMVCRFVIGAMLFLLLLFEPAQACLYEDPRVYESARPLVDRAREIFVGDVEDLKVSSDYRQYTVSVVEVLKGNPGKRIILKYPSFGQSENAVLKSEFEKPRDTFSNHNSAQFWLGRVAAANISLTSCQTIYAPKKGRHLIFLSPGVRNIFGFEAIEDFSDKWYLLVKKMVQNRKLPGLEIAPQDFVAMFPSIALWECGASSPRRVSQIRGEKINIRHLLEFYNAPNEPSVHDRCSSPSQRFIAMHVSNIDEETIGVPVSASGQLEFGPSYGHLFLTQRSMALKNLP